MKNRKSIFFLFNSFFYIFCNFHTLEKELITLCCCCNIESHVCMVIEQGTRYTENEKKNLYIKCC